MKPGDDRISQETCGECKWSEVIFIHGESNEKAICSHPDNMGRIVSGGPGDPPLRCDRYERHLGQWGVFEEETGVRVKALGV